jgi:Activator of Hsp90 ATPase homolog 1-like protein
MSSAARAATVTPAPVRKVIRVEAPQERAFRVFTAGMARWWRPEHHIAATPFVDLVVEPRSGGRWFERDKDGAECLWGKVILWEPPARLILGWQLNAEWKFDADFVTELEVRFIAEGPTATRVELEHRDLEKYGDKAAAVRASLDSPDGWNGLLATYVAEIAKA